MTRRALAAYLGAIVCIAWAVLTAWAFIHAAARRDDDVPDVQPTVTTTTAPSVTVRLGDNLTTSDAAGLVWSFDWRGYSRDHEDIN